jgi:hypothetical protein
MCTVEADHSPPSSAEATNGGLYLYYPIRLHAVVLKWLLLHVAWRVFESTRPRTHYSLKSLWEYTSQNTLQLEESLWVHVPEHTTAWRVFESTCPRTHYSLKGPREHRSQNTLQLEGSSRVQVPEHTSAWKVLESTGPRTHYLLSRQNSGRIMDEAAH